MPEKSPFRPRTTVHEQVAHQLPDGQPTATVTMFSRELASDEQVWQRDCAVGAAWEPLDHGWVEAAGQVIVENREGKRPQLVPTPEERAATDDLVVQWGVESPSGEVVPFGRIPPRGESGRIYPEDVTRLRLRSLNGGKVRVTVTVHPR